MNMYFKLDWWLGLNVLAKHTADRNLSLPTSDKDKILLTKAVAMVIIYKKSESKWLKVMPGVFYVSNQVKL